MSEENNELKRQSLSLKIVEIGLCYCSDDNPCHYHKELDDKNEEIARLKAEIAKRRDLIKRLVEALSSLGIEGCFQITSYHPIGGSISIGPNLTGQLIEALASETPKDGTGKE